MNLRKRTGAFKRIVWLMAVVIIVEIAVIFFAARVEDDDIAPLDAQQTTLPLSEGMIQFANETAAVPIATQFHFADATATAAIDRIIRTATARSIATPSP